MSLWVFLPRRLETTDRVTSKDASLVEGHYPERDARSIGTYL